MNLSKLRKLAWVFFALALTTTSVFSQGWKNTNRNIQNQNDNCLSYISGLTEKQQQQIVGMEEKHQKEMTELRDKRRSTLDLVEKNEIRGEMLKKVEAHQNSVKSILNEEQQEQYDQLHAYGFYGRGQNFAYCNDSRNFQGRGNLSGDQRFVRGNRGGQCYAYGNGSGRGTGQFCRGNYQGNYGNVNFRGNQGKFARGNGYGNRGNFRRAYGYGSGRFYWQKNDTRNENNQNEMPGVIEEK